MHGLKEFFAYNWFRDIWIPGAGAILIPVTIAFFTWWFGASRAEKQKEMQELRDNLNFLVSLTFSNITKFYALRERLEKCIKIESKTEGYIVQQELNLLFENIIAENYFELINPKDYNKCIFYDAEFITNLVIIKNILQLLHRKIEVHNEKMRKIGPIDEFAKDVVAAKNILKQDCDENKEFKQECNNIIIKLKNLALEIKQLESKIKGLRLNLRDFTSDEIKEFSKMEAEFNEFLKQEERMSNW